MTRTRPVSPPVVVLVSTLALALAVITALPAPAGAIPIGSPGGPGLPVTSGWQAINGPFSNLSGGDPFSTECGGRDLGPATCLGGARNPSYTSQGEPYQVDVPPEALGVPVTVTLDDPAFNLDGPAGDGYAGSAGQTGFATSFQLFDTTGDPTVISTAPSNGMNSLGLCTSGPGYAVFNPTRKVDDAPSRLCTFTPTVAGIYPVVVKTSAIPGVADVGEGQNDFFVSANSQDQVFDPLTVTPAPVDSVRVFTPTGKFGVVDVAQTHTGDSGHLLLVELFDPGDSPSGTVSMQLQPPFQPGLTTTPGATQSCDYSTPSAALGGGTMISSPTCTVTTRRAGAKVPTPYDGKWLQIETVIPPTICHSVCTWYVTYTSTKGPLDDRLTVEASVGPVPSS